MKRQGVLLVGLLCGACDSSLRLFDRAQPDAGTDAGGDPCGPSPGVPLELARSADGFVDSVGVRLNLTYSDTPYRDRDAVIGHVTALGIRHVMDFGDVRRSEVIDGYNGLAPFGVRGMVTLGLGADVPTLLAPYGGSLEAVMLWRGPSRENPYTPAELVSAASQTGAAVRMMPGALVVVAPDVSDADAAALPTLGAYVDFGTVNVPLGPGAPAGTTIPPGDARIDAALETRRPLFGDRPFVSVGIGYDTSTSTTGVSEPVQAKYVPRLLLENWNRGVARTFVFGLLDFHAEVELGWKRMGLVRPDGTTKPAYGTVKRLLETLRDPGPAIAAASLALAVSGGNPATRPVHHTLLRKRDGTFVLVLWLEGPSQDEDVRAPVTVEVKGRLTEVALVPLGVGEAVAVAPDTAKRVTVEASDRPVLLRFRAECP